MKTFRNAAAFSILFAAASFAVPTPIVELKMDAGSGTTTSNTGSGGGSGTLTSTKPTWNTEAPVNGSNSLDFGTTAGQYAVDVTNSTTVNALKSLKSFTITGWVNNKSSSVGAGGNRIVAWNNSYLGGAELAYDSDGSLRLGVDEWNNSSGTPKSSGGKIPTSSSGSYNNWRFFAVTYDGTATSSNVKFYFGSNSTQAVLDVTRSYNRGTTGAGIASGLSVGNHTTADDPYQGGSATTRSSFFTCMFRGLVDQVRVYGSTTSSSGALSIDDIVAIQNAATIAADSGSGILYEEWTGIGGTTLDSLIASPNYPNSPSATMTRPTFDAFQNRADNFGARMSGWVLAPTTGNYYFWILANNNGELRVSTDANPTNKRLVAWTYQSPPTGYTSWDVTPMDSRRSGSIHLTAGQYYYVEALMKEGTGDDHLRVGWQLPSTTNPEGTPGGALERPIPATRIFVVPPDLENFFPSALNLYEKGTVNKKAVVGWHKEAGNDHFYVDAEDQRRIRVFSDTTFLDGPRVKANDLVAASVSTARLQADSANITALTIGTAVTGSVQAGFLRGDSVRANQYVAAPSFRGGNVSADTLTADTIYSPGLGAIRVQTSTVRAIYARADSMRVDSVKAILVRGDSMRVSRYIAAPYVLADSILTDTVRAINVQADSVRADSMKAVYVRADSIRVDTLTAVFARVDSIRAASLVTTPRWKVVPDYVFEKDYKLRSLAETETFVRKHKHLPEIPSAREIGKNGMDLTEMNLQLLKKVEELTLHLIEMDKELKALKATKSKHLKTAKSGKK